MANQRANKVTIPIDGALDMNRYRANVRQFEGLNDNNGVIFGGTLSPLWRKDGARENAVFDKDGNKYSLANGQLIKTDTDDNETLLMSVTEQTFEKYSIDIKKDFIAADMFLDDNGNGAFVGVEVVRLLSRTAFILEAYTVTNFAIDADFYDTVTVYLDGYIISPVVRLRMKEVPVINGRSFFAGAYFMCYGNGNYAYGRAYLGYDNGFSGMFAESLFENRVFNPGTGNVNLSINTLMDHLGLIGVLACISSDTGVSEIFAINTGPILRDALTVNDVNTSRFFSVSLEYFTLTEDPVPYLVPIRVMEGTQGQGYPVLSGAEVLSVEDTYVITLRSQFLLGHPKDNFLFWNIHRAMQYVRASLPVNASHLNVTTYNAQSITCITASSDADGNLFPNFGDFYCFRDFRMLVDTSNEDGSLVVSAISFGNAGKNSSVGTLLTDWYEVDNEFPVSLGKNFVMYKSKDGLKFIFVRSGNGKLSIIDDRYVVANAPDLNCYDLKKSESVCYALDWNDRVLITGNWDDAKGNAFFASAFNLNYESSGDGLVSRIAAPRVIKAIGEFGGFVPIGALNFSIDTFYGVQTIDYFRTISVFYSSENITTVFKKENGKVGTSYPVYQDGNYLYPPSLLSELIKSFVNKDLIIIGETAYPIKYSGGMMVLLYAMLNGIENVTDVFVIQGQHYVISMGKIFSISYGGDAISSFDAISDCTGYQYLGCNTKAAFFYSALDRSIYSFTGDNVLNRLYEADRIKAVNGAFYNPITQSIYISTTDETAEDGEAKEVQCLYIFGRNTARIDGVPKVNALYCTEKKFIVLDTDGGLIYLAYTELDGYEKQTLKVRTEFYGTGNNEVSVIDCWYVRLFNGNRKTAGKVKFRVRTLTDKGTETAEKTVSITPDMWDELTNTAYIRYQPERQRGVGAQLYIESDFAIGQIACDYLPDTQQIAHINA